MDEISGCADIYVHSYAVHAVLGYAVQHSPSLSTHPQVRKRIWRALGSLREMQTKVGTEAVELHSAQILGENISGIVSPFDIEYVGDASIVHFTDVVVANVNVLRPHLCYSVLSDVNGALVVSRQWYIVEMIAKLSKQVVNPDYLATTVAHCHIFSLSRGEGNGLLCT